MITVDNMREGYHDILANVLRWGQPVSPRGKATLERLGQTIVVRDPRNTLPVWTGRLLNVNLAKVEALQLMGGVATPETLKRVSSQFTQFAGEGEVFHGAYGPRIRPQLWGAIKALQLDSDTRRAVMTIWDPLHDQQTGIIDIPCTLTLQFMIRNNALDLHVTMRSNDVWRGLAYDAFQFTQLQLNVAAHLGIEVGTYYHHANSLHIYDDDVPMIEKMLADPKIVPLRDDEPWMRPLVPWDGFNFPAVARDILAGKTAAQLANEGVFTPTVEWYKEY